MPKLQRCHYHRSIRISVQQTQSQRLRTKIQLNRQPSFLKTKGCKWEFVKPSNHRVDAAEQVIQTFKNHFISGLASTDESWHLQLWDQLTTYTFITLNILRRSRINATKSADKQFHGQVYNWNAHPLAPPGTRTMIYEDAITCTSWGPRGMDELWCGPSFDHYRCPKLYCPETRSYCISGSVDLFPQHCLLPEVTLEQHVKEVHKELIESIGRLNKSAKQKVVKALTKMARDLATPPMQGSPQRVGPAATSQGGGPTHRVVTALPVTITTDPTAPHKVVEAPRTHRRVTKNNTPKGVPIIQTESQTPRRSPRGNPNFIIKHEGIDPTPN